MTTLPTSTHDAFTLTRRFDAEPGAVFDLFADEEKWRRWFRMPGRNAAYAHDFRVGGHDRATAEFAHLDGRVEVLEMDLHYLDIVPGERIVYAYRSVVDDVVRWASLVTILLRPAEDGPGGTELGWTEQVAFLALTGDGADDLPHLRGAIQLRFNALAVALG